jgi:hypothetical protein
MSNRIHLSALRPDDLLALEFEFANLQLAADNTLERVAPGQPAFIIVHFPPQHLTEKVFSGNSASLEPPPIRTALAGESRLVFRLPEAIDRLSLTLPALLNWETWEPIITSGPPSDLETAIEFPWRLILSPDEKARWQHTIEPITINGNTEVWRTHLMHLGGQDAGAALLTPGGDLRALAAIEGQSPFSPPPPVTDATSLGNEDRRNLVQLTSIAAGLVGNRPLHAELLSLSTLGATASLLGEWPDGPAMISLRKYQHVATQGRDQFVRTVRMGFLCGTGHRSVVITTTERAPVTKAVVGNSPAGGALFGTAAYLNQRYEVFVIGPDMDYGPLASAYSFSGREMPLRSIHLVTRTAEIKGSPANPFTSPTWLLTPEGQPLFFRATALDVAGNQIDFELPLMFVPLEATDNIGLVRHTYFSPPFSPDLATNIKLNGQLLAMAEPGDKPGSTQIKADTFRFGLATVGDVESGFGLQAAGLPPSYPPRYLPFIRSAHASVPAVEQLLGSAQPQAMQHELNYLVSGFNPATNPAQTFVRLLDSLPLEFASQSGGGLVRPNSTAEALSRTLGPISAPDKLATGKIDLSAFGNARFLGTIRLLDLILPDSPGDLDLPFDAASASAEPPTQEQLYNDPSFRLNQPRLITRRAGQSVETRFLWKPSLLTKSFGPLKVDLDHAELLLDARTTRAPSGEGTSLVIGRLRGAALAFVGTITVAFGELVFRAEEGRKMEVGAKNIAITFEGPLEFVNSLRSILPSSGFDDPPFLQVDGQGVVAGYTLGIPTIEVGVFSIQNIGLTAAISIPFTDRPAGVRFSISERHKPFLVTVSLFGGGGFFGLAVSAKGLEQIEASIEFGGNIALNLFIASGGVYVMAGIYFALTAGSVTLTGFLRCGGYLEVLGLISISVEFYLAFTYHKKNAGGSEVYGQASLTVCVKIAFFSKSVSLSIERRFAGSDGDPSFADTVSLNEWAKYLLAFA